MVSHKSVKNATLTDADIPGLRKRLRTKQTTVAEEADRYGVGVETIRRANRGETFRHIRDFLDETSIPGERPEMATGHPLPLPEDLLEDAEASLRRVRKGLGAESAGARAVDEFLSKRPPPNPLDEEEEPK